MTADELYAHPLENVRSELVRGMLVLREPARLRHGDVAARALIAIAQFVAQHRLGRVVAAETGFTLQRNPDTVRAPDVAYVRADHWPSEADARFADWINAGVSLVWIVDPKRRSAHVYRADGTASLLSADDALEGEDVLPGFRELVSTFVD